MQPSPPVLPVFFGAKLALHGTVNALMAQPVVWETAPGGEVAGAALFREPTEDQVIMPHARNADGATFTSTAATITYGVTQFEGLEAAVKTRGAREVIRLSDGRRWLVGNVERKYDGQYIEAILNPLKPLV